MAIYIILIMIILMMNKKDNIFIEIGENTRSITDVKLFILMSTLAIIAGFRYQTGTDYINYQKAFDMINAGTDIGWLNFEPGFILLNIIVGELFGNAQYLFIIVAIITIMLFGISFKQYSYDSILSVFLFVTLYFYFGSFNYIRQYIAIAITLLAFNDIENRNFKKFVFKIIMASLFHTTSIIVLPFYFLANKKVRISIYISISLALIAFRIFYHPILSIIVKVLPKYALYFGYQAGGSTINMIVLAINFILLLLVNVNSSSFSKTDAVELNIYTNACFVAMCIYAFSPINTLFSRIGSYFFIYSTLSIPFFLKTIKKNESYYLLSKAIICLVSICICYYYLRANNNGVVPYTWYFIRQI